MTSASAPIGLSTAISKELTVAGGDRLATTAACSASRLAGKATHVGRDGGTAATDRISDRACRETASSHPAPIMTMKTTASAARLPAKALRTIGPALNKTLRGLDIPTRSADLVADVIERATRQGTIPSTVADYG